VDPEGLVGARNGVWGGCTPSRRGRSLGRDIDRKNAFEMAYFGAFWAVRFVRVLAKNVEFSV